MDYDELKKRYDTHFCFSPWQGDFFYDKKIEWHLNRLIEICSECREKDVLPDIREHLEFFDRLDVNDPRLLNRLVSALSNYCQIQRYDEAGAVLKVMCRKYGQAKLFRWG